MRLPANQGLRDEIVRVSIELGTDLGEDGLTMRAIAARLGVSATGLYQHFESKAAILSEIRLLGARTLAHAQSQALKLEHTNGRARLKRVARSYVEFAQTNPWMYKLLYCGDDSDWNALADDERAQLAEPHRQVTQVVETGIADGEFAASFDPKHASLVMWASVHGLASFLIHKRLDAEHPTHPVHDNERFIDDFLNVVVCGLA